MIQNNLWSKHQNGFKKKSRTEDNLFILKSMIHQSNDVNKTPLYACFVDFSKFFDTIDRNMLFYKLQKLGIVGNTYNIIKTMYINCLYAIKQDNFLSEFFNSTVGVKQGCPLSPILSNLFQNDLHTIFDQSCGPIPLGTQHIKLFIMGR